MQVVLGQDPEDPEFVWVELEQEPIAETALYYDVLARLTENVEVGTDDGESEIGSVICFTGGLSLEEVSHLTHDPEPMKKARLAFRGPGGLGIWEVGLKETLERWHQRIGLSCWGSGQDGYFTTIGWEDFGPEGARWRLGNWGRGGGGFSEALAGRWLRREWEGIGQIRCLGSGLAPRAGLQGVGR